jgi:hypothetical protein
MITRFIPLLGAALALSACASERITRPAAPSESPARAISSVATDVVYFLDGKEITAKQVETLDPRSIHAVDVIKGESARRMLGDRAAYGVIMITSKAAVPSR